MHIKKLILVCIFLGSFQALKCEYIIYKKLKNGSIETVKDNARLNLYNKIQNTLFKYQWPTCIAHFHEVNQNEIAKYTAIGSASEENYLRAKIKEIDKNLDLAFFPTSLYELFFIINYQKYNQNFNLDQFICEANITNIINDPTNNLETIYKNIMSFNQINTKIGSSENIHLTVNNDLVKYIRSFKFYKNSNKQSITNLIEQNIDFILVDLLSKVPDTNKWDENTCKKILNLEYKAHKNNSGLIYRGNLSLYSFINSESVINPIEVTYLFSPYLNNFSFKHLALTKNESNEFKRLINQEKLNNLKSDEQVKLSDLKNEFFDSFCWDSPSRSISYGNSIFAAILRDHGACSFNYINEKDSLGYALYINKWLYYKGLYASENEKKSLGNLIDGELFIISPFNTLTALFGYNIWFHTRSKSYYFSKDLMQSFDIPFIPGIGPIKDLTGYFIKNGNPLQKGAELAQFIAERAELIKVPDYLGGFNFTPQVANSYFTSQSNMAESFKTMTFLEPYLRQQLGIQRV